MKHVITILAEGFEEIEAVTFIDILRRAHIQVTILGLKSFEIKGAHDIRIRADHLLADFKESYDGIILAGGQPGTTNLIKSPDVLKIVKTAHTKGLLLGAICAAPSVLAEAGILDGYKVTCYPGVEERLGNAIFVEEPVVVDRTIITSRGVGTAINFAIELVRYLNNDESADKISKAILFNK
ncbi:MAG: DJ-1/PfpI family protein [Fibrobacter sp.]|nr:DJ-1/PfpI family protein [Fibrobacter sp.]